MIASDKTVRIWDLATGQTIQTIQGHNEVSNPLLVSIAQLMLNSTRPEIILIFFAIDLVLASRGLSRNFTPLSPLLFLPTALLRSFPESFRKYYYD